MKKGKQAFTLIELVVAMGITSVLALVAFQFMDSLISVWNQTDRNIGVESESRTALEQIAADIESAFFEEGHGTMFAVDRLANNTNSGQWVVPSNFSRPAANSYDPFNHRYGWAGSWLRFFTADPSLNAVGYQIIRAPQMGTATDEGYHLYRGLVRSDYTVETGFDIENATYETSGTPTLANPVEVVSPRKENIIASNVIDFGVRLYVFVPGASIAGTPDGMRMIFPATAAGALDATKTQHLATTAGSADHTIQFPDAVEVFMRIIDRDGAGKLFELEENGASNAQWNAIVAEHSTLYSRFITIKGGVL